MGPTLTCRRGASDWDFERGLVDSEDTGCSQGSLDLRMCLRSAPLASLPRAAFHLQGTHQPDGQVTAPTSYRQTWGGPTGHPGSQTSARNPFISWFPYGPILTGGLCDDCRGPVSHSP